MATCDRPAGLAALLESLRRQKLPQGLCVEIVVVDNDPEARALASATPREGERFLHEPRRNIAHARNRALAAARGRWIAFVDDDEVVDEGWLAAYWELLQSGSGEPAAGEAWDGLFGPVIPRLARPGPSWLDLETFYARPCHASGTPLSLAELRTSNALVRRAAIPEPAFDPAYGRSGGSDSELFGRMARAGAHFGFCAGARVTETIPPERHTLRWLARRRFRGGLVHTRQERARCGGRAWLGLPRALAALLACGLALPVAALAGRRAAARVWLRACTQAGHLVAFSGGRFEEYRPRP